MGDRSKIEWTQATWSPIRARNRATGKVGWYCEHVSEGCRNCYAEGINRRLGTGLPFKPGHREDLEPLLGPIDLGVIVRKATFEGTIYADGKTHPLGWVIVGGESGPNVRPMHPQWARSLRDQCTEAGVPFFFKQWGSHFPVFGADGPVTPALYDGPIIDGVGFANVGKKVAGRLLDGRAWDEMPEKVAR